ncbi:hypothetical protein [Rhodococcus sp. NPDC049939]
MPMTLSAGVVEIAVHWAVDRLGGYASGFENGHALADRMPLDPQAV